MKMIKYCFFVFLIQFMTLDYSYASVFEPQFSDVKNSDYKVNSLSLIDPSSLLVIYNDDGTIRGGAYNIGSFGGIYVASLHTIAGSRFYELHKDFYRFYVFKNSEKDVGIDVVILVDRRLYPEGAMNGVFSEMFHALANRSVRPSAIGYAINGIVINRSGQSDFLIRTNSGELFYNRKNQKTYIRLEAEESTIKAGSSGTVVVAKPSDLYNAPLELDYDLNSNIAVGILKCRLVKASPYRNKILYEVQTFEFMDNPNYWMEELTSPPKIIFEKDCEQINGRGHGGA